MSGTTEYRRAVRQIRDRLRCDFVALARVHGVNRPLLTWDYASGSLGGGYKRIVLSPGQGIAGSVSESGRGLVIQSSRSGVAFDHNLPGGSIVSAEKLESVAALPLYRDDRVWGVLLVGYRIPSLMTESHYGRVLEAVCQAFPSCQVPRLPYGELLGAQNGENLRDVPVYELLTDHIIQAQEDERQRISRELHDGVVQDLLSVQMALRTVKYCDDREEMLEAVARADGSLGELQKQLRNLAVSLRPVILDDLGLTAAFRSHFQGIEAGYGVAVQFAENVGGARYSHNLETMFYRICQEAVLNACKYSGADRIDVSLLRIGGELVLEVADGGVGFSPKTLGRSGVGLRSMAERAELIGGELDLRSAPGEGTRLRLSVELAGEEQEAVNREDRVGG